MGISVSGQTLLYVGTAIEGPEILGRSVTTVDTQDDALAALDGVDCVISEYDLADGDGLTLLEAVRDRRPAMPFVLVPETADSDVASRAVDGGVTAFLPRDLPEFRRRLGDRIEEVVVTGTATGDSVFAKMIDGVGVGVALYAADGRFRYVNPTYARMLDRDPPSLVEEPIWAVNPAVDPDRFDGYWDSFDEGDTRRAETTHLQADGTELPVETHTTAITVGDRRYHVGTITDISARLADRRALERQNERLEQFASVISHDLRNPLDVAMGRTTVMAEEYESEHLDAISGALDRMDELITDVLTLAREGKQIQDPERVVLESIVETAWETAGTDGATLQIGSLGLVEADASRLQQLFENLFRNSIIHGKTDGEEITITVDRFDPDGSAGGFYVADDGVGFGDVGPGKLFEHGFSTTDGGTGFGLAIVETIADAHGWRVRARPTENGGARIDVLDVEWQ